MYSALSQKRCSSAMHPFFHFAMVAIEILTFLPVGGMDLPSGIFIGSEKVASNTPVATVQSPEPKEMGCEVIRESGVPLKRPLLMSETCCSIPCVTLPSGN